MDCRLSSRSSDSSQRSEGSAASGGLTRPSGRRRSGRQPPSQVKLEYRPQTSASHTQDPSSTSGADARSRSSASDVVTSSEERFESELFSEEGELDPSKCKRCLSWQANGQHNSFRFVMAPDQLSSSDPERYIGECVQEVLKTVNALLNDCGGLVCLHFCQPCPLATLDEIVDRRLSSMIANDLPFEELFERHVLDRRHVVYRIKPSDFPCVSTLTFNSPLALNNALVEPTQGQMRRLMQRAVAVPRLTSYDSSSNEERRSSQMCFRHLEPVDLFPGCNVRLEECNLFDRGASNTRSPLCLNVSTDTPHLQSYTQMSLVSQSASTDASYTLQDPSSPNAPSARGGRIGTRWVHIETADPTHGENWGQHIADYWWNELQLPGYISAFSKSQDGGSIYLGIAEERSPPFKAWVPVECQEFNQVFETKVKIWQDREADEEKKIFYLAEDKDVPEVKGHSSGRFICQGVQLSEEERKSLKSRLLHLVKEQLSWFPNFPAGDPVHVYFHTVAESREQSRRLLEITSGRPDIEGRFRNLGLAETDQGHFADLAPTRTDQGHISNPEFTHTAECHVSNPGIAQTGQDFSFHPDLCIVEVKVTKFLGVVFRNKRGPEAYKISLFRGQSVVSPIPLAEYARLQQTCDSPGSAFLNTQPSSRV